MDKVVADARPMLAVVRIADMVRHAGRPRRKDRDVGAAFALEFELRAFEALADLVVGDADLDRFGRFDVLEAGDLPVAEVLSCLGAVV